MLFSVFERAKIGNISIGRAKMSFLRKNNSLACSCLFDKECLILRPKVLAVEIFDHILKDNAL